MRLSHYPLDLSASDKAMLMLIIAISIGVFFLWFLWKSRS
jgi:hypothetical protein